MALDQTHFFKCMVAEAKIKEGKVISIDKASNSGEDLLCESDTPLSGQRPPGQRPPDRDRPGMHSCYIN